MKDDLAPFESPKLLIEGAKTCIPEFESDCRAFVKTCGYDVVTHLDAKNREKVVKIRLKGRIPGKVRVLASRILNDLRHSLDQAVCDGAIELGRKDGRGIYFPFGKTSDDLNREFVARCKGVDADLIQFIRAFNAHVGGDDLLYALSLAGPNKHQRIVGLYASNGGFDLNNGRIVGHPGAGNFRLGSGEWSELSNEIEIARVGINIEMTLNITPLFYVIIGAGKPPLSDPAPTVFDALAYKVEGIVLGIEAETARLLRERAV